jgi:peptidoglycan/LPS O-acetylase OafA/YrhL
LVCHAAVDIAARVSGIDDKFRMAQPNIPATTPSTKRMAHLDGIRGWAALFVVLHHVALTFEPSLFDDGSPAALGPISFLIDGSLAVDMFFILSGIVLAAATDSAREGLRRFSFVGLMTKRWLRLAVPIAVVAAAAWLLFRTHVNLAPLAGMVADSSWATGLFPKSYHPALGTVLWEALYGAFAGMETPFHNPVLWTIRVEFPGSAIVFALCLLFRRRVPRIAASSAVAVLLLQVSSWLLNFCALFPVGIVFWEIMKAQPGGGASASKRPHGERDLWWDLAGLAMALSGLVLIPTIDLLPAALHSQQEVGVIAGDFGMQHVSVWTIRATLIIAGVCLSPTAMRALSGSMSLFLGRISFSIYLAHSLVLISLGALTYLLLHRDLGHALSSWIAGVTVVLVSVAIGWTLHRWVERPSMRLASRVGAAIDGWWHQRKSALLNPYSP